MKQKALVICPGRGTYNKDDLGYLHRYHANKSDFINEIDNYRAEQGQAPVSELDALKNYDLQKHTSGDNASSLIYACAYSDFLSINQDKFDIVAITGNSMGWYISLACGGAVSPQSGTKIINTMGTLMQENTAGGQVIYPLVDENWQEISGRKQALLSLADEINDLYISIILGGMLVFAGSDEALDTLMKKLKPKQKRFPLRVSNHGAFHTKLMRPIAQQGQKILTKDLFSTPAIPLIDGRGKIWSPYSTDIQNIWDYTFNDQVCETYNFTKSIQVSVKEFAPEKIIILGPGNTLGSAVAQSLLDIKWQGMTNKENFITRQKNDPYILSMGLEEQRKLVI